MLKYSRIHGLIGFLGWILVVQTVSAQLQWHDSVESARETVAGDKNKLYVVVQFHSHGEINESALLREYERQIASNHSLVNLLAANATLVAESVSSKERNERRQARRKSKAAQNIVSTVENRHLKYCLTLFCNRQGQVVHFWVGLPSGAELLEVTKEALDIIRGNRAADDFDEAIRNAHQDLLSAYELEILESILPAAPDAENITNTTNAEELTKTPKAGTTDGGDLSSLERVFIGVRSVRRQDFKNRFGAGLNEKELQILVRDLESDVSIGTELINMLMARIPCMDLRRVDRYLWALFSNQYIQRSAAQIDDLVVTARMEKRPIILKIASDKAGFVEGLPRSTNRKIKQQLRDFETGVCSLDELNTVTRLLGASPVVVSLHEEILWYLATFDGSTTEIILDDDFETLKSTVKKIRKANK